MTNLDGAGCRGIPIGRFNHMKAFFAWLFGSVLGLAVLVGLVVGLSVGGWYLHLWYLQHIESQSITIHARNVRHSLDFTQAANLRAGQAMAEYKVATDTAHASADLVVFCQAAGSINPDERYADVESFFEANCK